MTTKKSNLSSNVQSQRNLRLGNSGIKQKDYYPTLEYYPDGQD
jgi:hypothetical protein